MAGDSASAGPDGGISANEFRGTAAAAARDRHPPEFVIYMRRDCHVCRAEGFQAQTRVLVTLGKWRIIATVNVIDSDLLAPGEASLSASGRPALSAGPDDAVEVSTAPTLDSPSAMRARFTATGWTRRH